MKLGHRANERFMFDADHIARRESARRAAGLAYWAWRYHAMKVGIDPNTFNGSPLDEVAKRRAVIANGEAE